MAKIKKTNNTKYWLELEKKTELSYITGVSIKCLHYFGNGFAFFLIVNIYPQDDSTILFIVTQDNRNVCPQKKVVHKCLCQLYL